MPITPESTSLSRQCCNSPELYTAELQYKLWNNTTPAENPNNSSKSHNELPRPNKLKARPRNRRPRTPLSRYSTPTPSRDLQQSTPRPNHAPNLRTSRPPNTKKLSCRRSSPPTHRLSSPSFLIRLKRNKKQSSMSNLTVV